MDAFIRPRRPVDPVFRLIVCHHAGGSGSSYHPLARQLPQDWEVLLLDLPGRGKRHGQRALTSMSQIVDLATADLLGLPGGPPFGLFGHSMGAIVASEVTGRLTLAGRAPDWLGVSGRLAPGDAPVHRATLHELADSDLLAEIEHLGGVPEQLKQSPAYLQSFVDLLRADLTAVEGYRTDSHELAAESSLSVFTGDEDPWAPAALMPHWATHSPYPLALHQFSGGHFYHCDAGTRPLAEALIHDVRNVLGAPKLLADRLWLAAI